MLFFILVKWAKSLNVQVSEVRTNQITHKLVKLYESDHTCKACNYCVLLRKFPFHCHTAIIR